MVPSRQRQKEEKRPAGYKVICKNLSFLWDLLYENCLTTTTTTTILITIIIIIIIIIIEIIIIIIIIITVNFKRTFI